MEDAKPLLSFDQAVQLFFARSDTVQTFWNLYIAVTVGLLAFASAVGPPKGLAWKWVVPLSFFVFASSNLCALLEVQRQRRALAEIANNRAGGVGEVSPLVEQIRVPNLYGIGTFHFGVTLAVCVSLHYLLGGQP